MPSGNFTAPTGGDKDVLAKKTDLMSDEKVTAITGVSASLVAMAGSSAPAPHMGPPMASRGASAEALRSDKVSRIQTFTSNRGTGSGSGSLATPMRSRGAFNTEAYDAVEENRFLEAKTTPLSTFSIDVDTASYANVRRFLNDGQLPPKGAVRIEEMLNDFSYSYPQPDDGRPFSVNVETARAPWNSSHELVRIGIQGRKLNPGKRPAANLVFLIDVSGSMPPENKLPLLKRSLAELAKNLGENDCVSIAVHAGKSAPSRRPALTSNSPPPSPPSE